MIGCPECGAVNEPATQMIARLQADLAGAERELRTKRARIGQLEADRRKLPQSHPRYEDALEVLGHWRDVCAPKTKELGGKRMVSCLARFDGGYEVADLKQAVDGYARHPYVVDGRRATHGRKDQRYIDAELIFRDAKHVDAGLELAEYASFDDPAPSVPAKLTELGRRALRYVTHMGWHVFPVRPGEKVPMTRNGLLDARCEPREIERFWTAHPKANIGVRTGKESGIVVLDVDGELGAETLRRLEKLYGRLPTTASIVTPRGGEHFYFQWPGVEIRNTQGVPGPGLDIRGDGGYVLVPPSLVGERPYEVDDQVPISPMPDWLVNALIGYQRRWADRVDPAVWERMVTAGVKEGERNGQLTRLTGYLAAHLPDDYGVVLGIVRSVNHDRCFPPLPDDEVERIVASIRRRQERRS